MKINPIFLDYILLSKIQPESKNFIIIVILIQPRLDELDQLKKLNNFLLENFIVMLN